MKLTINQNSAIQETEIIINCSALDHRIRNLADYIRQYSASLDGYIDGQDYYVPLDTILYIDSVDKKTFFYDRHRIYSSRYTLAELEERLKNTLFLRISKNCIVNMSYVHHTAHLTNHRQELIMINGERLIVSRSYFAAFRERYQDFNTDLFHHPSFPARDVLEHDPERAVYNSGKIMEFSCCPRRAAALSYEAAELMAALGLTERLIAIAPAECPPEQLTSQYQPLLVGIPVLTDHDKGVPTLEQLRELQPDFVFGSYYSLRTLEDRAHAKLCDYQINMYVSEGTVPEHATMEFVYRDILNLGKIFRVENRAIELVSQMRKRVAALTRQVELCSMVRVFVYDSHESAPVTAMGGTLENDLIALARGKNVFGESKKAYVAVSWQQVAEAKPEVIIIHSYHDYLNAEEKIRILKNCKALRDVPAVREERFVILTYTEIFPGIQNVAAVEKLIRAFHPGRL